MTLRRFAPLTGAGFADPSGHLRGCSALLRSVTSAFVLLMVLLLGAPVAAGEPGDDGSGPAPTNEVPDQAPGGGIIPAPDSGVAPESPGDRGGWAQLAVLAVLVGGLGVMAALVVRSARRARTRDRTRSP
ncbi:hypothetical protein BH20ACT2_BH20ACT2_04050 [soil metagenome]